MRRTFRFWTVGIGALALTVALAGCSQPSKTVELQPKVSPPAIQEAGTLRAGVNADYPPFAGSDNGRQAGLDLDVAAALAERLGLKLKVVPVKPSEAATALADGDVDVVFSVPFSAESLSEVSLAGSYIADGPGFFVAADSTASAVPTMTTAKLPTAPGSIGAQKGSAAYWRLVRSMEPGTVKGYDTLREALDALNKKSVQVVAGDTLVAAYISRDFPKVRFAGQMSAAGLLGVGVAPDNSTLEDAVNGALDELAAGGVLDNLRQKWVGDLPKLTVTASSTAGEATPTVAP